MHTACEWTCLWIKIHLCPNLWEAVLRVWSFKNCSFLNQSIKISSLQIELRDLNLGYRFSVGPKWAFWAFQLFTLNYASFTVPQKWLLNRLGFVFVIFRVYISYILLSIIKLLQIKIWPVDLARVLFLPFKNSSDFSSLLCPLIQVFMCYSGD